MNSKSKIDKSGQALASKSFLSEDHELDSEIVFDEYRRVHLSPLTDATHQIQTWLSHFDRQYYIAQRLKRKPQILRKMRRFSVRLTQLQDIAGNRVIVDTNDDVEALRRYIRDRVSTSGGMSIIRETDYRALGRDDTGYRALHIILAFNGVKIEMQLRSRAQHYWAECIERTSVIYGHHLKEGDGDHRVIDYFKSLSYIFFELECKREPTSQQKIDLDSRRVVAEMIIGEAGKAEILRSYVSDDIIHTLSAVEKKGKGTINNWILIFDWNSGHFVNWQAISRDPAVAYDAYSAAENHYSETDGYEVVLVGSSDVAMIRRTHSHYFGIDGYDSILKNLDESVIGFSIRRPVDASARRVLHILHRKNYWGRKSVSFDTLKNHYCKTVFGLEEALDTLVNLGLISMATKKGPISLNSSRRDEIKSYL